MVTMFCLSRVVQNKQGFWSQTDLGSSPASDTYLLCALEQVV